jgi:hypothetical protein
VRLVRRVNDARYPDALFQVCRYHRFLTNSDLSTTSADRTTQSRHDIGTGHEAGVQQNLSTVPRFPRNTWQ